MKARMLFLSFGIVSLFGCTPKNLVQWAAQPRKCNPRSERLLAIKKCDGQRYCDVIIPVTAASLLAQRHTSKRTFFMFFDSGCHGFPTTMPPYLDSLQAMDSIHPVLVLVDDYREVPVCRERIKHWGWKGPVHILDQDHYGCFNGFDSERDSLVLNEFGIRETPCYHCTVSLEVLVDPKGKVIGYSNHHDLPNELRGKNLP